MEADKNKIQSWQLKQRQAMPLWMKIEYSNKRIKTWYEHWDGQVYVSFSGGKDSTVLLSLVRKIYPEVPAVFVDTGLEYPEIRKFVKTIDNVIWIKPKMRFDEVINKYGYPAISKQVARYVRDLNGNSDKLKTLRLTGICGDGRISRCGKLSRKWVFMKDAPFRISEQCCDVMKKNPMKKYIKESNRYPITGEMADESSMRMSAYLYNGCNGFNLKIPKSTPIAFWKDNDIWEYIRSEDIPYSSIYDTGVTRTGCMFCMFGVHLEKEPNRFQLMKTTHPKQYNYCMNVLGLRQVLEYIGVKYK